MEMKADTSRVLMSDALRGKVPEELEDEAAASLERSAVTVVVATQVGDQQSAVVGLLRSVLFEAEPELELRLQLDDALAVASAQSLQLLGFELHHGERVIASPGPFILKGMRIDDIDAANQLCTLSLGLKRPPKA